MAKRRTPDTGPFSFWFHQAIDQWQHHKCGMKGEHPADACRRTGQKRDVRGHAYQTQIGWQWKMPLPAIPNPVIDQVRAKLRKQRRTWVEREAFRYAGAEQTAGGLWYSAIRPVLIIESN